MTGAITTLKNGGGVTTALDQEWRGERIDYERITAMATRDRPAHTLIAMAPKNDPFYITPGRRKNAEWFAVLWRQHCRHRPNMHIRGIHYVLVSLENRPNRMRGPTPYENTEDCFKELDEASRDARLLDLVPIDRIDDKRNDAPIEHLPNYGATDSTNAALSITDARPLAVDVMPLETIGLASALLTGGLISRLMVLGLSSAPSQLEMPAEIEAPDVPEMDVEIDEVSRLLLLPLVTVFPPRVTPPWFHIELWCEKTSMNDIMLEIARERRLNVITGPGYQSLTNCKLLIDRAKRSGRPVSILYISDFDQAGQGMPVAVARVIEFLLHREKLDLDIQLIPVALTHAQCIEYRLPRTPIKDTVKGKRAFEERYGEGGTELDALEAIHPGVLRRILLRAIDPYSDPTFPDRMREAGGSLRNELDRIRAGIIAPYREELDALVAAPQELVGQRNTEVAAFVTERLAALNAEIAELAAGPIESINDRLADVQDQVNIINAEIRRLFATRIVPLNEVLDQVRSEAEALNAEVRRRRAAGIGEINAGIRLIDGRCEVAVSEVTARVEVIQQAIKDELEIAARPALDDIAWPEPVEDASVDPLFDSRRTYVEQMDRYKQHLGKATTRKINKNRGKAKKRNLSNGGESG